MQSLKSGGRAESHAIGGKIRGAQKHRNLELEADVIEAIKAAWPHVRDVS